MRKDAKALSGHIICTCTQNERCSIHVWNELDGAAEANLEGDALPEFYRYKEQLKSEGHKWQDDASDILSGYIWDASEEPYNEDNET